MGSTCGREQQRVGEVQMGMTTVKPVKRRPRWSSSGQKREEEDGCVGWGGEVGALGVRGMVGSAGQHWLLGGCYLHIRGVASRHEREGEIPRAKRGKEGLGVKRLTGGERGGPLEMETVGTRSGMCERWKSLRLALRRIPHAVRISSGQIALAGTVVGRRVGRQVGTGGIRPRCVAGSVMRVGGAPEVAASRHGRHGRRGRHGRHGRRGGRVAGTAGRHGRHGRRLLWSYLSPPSGDSLPLTLLTPTSTPPTVYTVSRSFSTGAGGH